MKCSTARKLVYQVLDGDLPEELQQAFEGHLERCPACAQDWEQVRADEVAFAGKVVLAPAPPDFVARVMARVRAAEVWEGADRVRVGSGRRAVPLRYALIGAASMAVLFLVLLHWPRTSPPPKIRTAEQPLVSPSPITRHPSPITHHPSPVTHHPSPITHHPSPVTRHPSPVVAWVLSPPEALSVRTASGSAWRPLTLERTVRRGELLKTGEAVTELSTARGDRVWLNRSTVVQFRGRELALFAGEMFVEAKPSSRGLVVRTPGTATTVHGTRFDVKLVGRAAQVTVVEGSVKVGTSGGACLLEASQQTVASPGSPPSRPEGVDVRAVIAWTGIQIPEPKVDQPEVIQAQAPPPVPSCELTGVTFTVKPETEAGDFAEAEALTFVLTVDYAEAAPRLLKLTATVTDAKGKVVLEREETIADEQYRYRIKKILLDPLSPGDYVGRFKLSAEAGELTQEVQFSVRPPD